MGARSTKNPINSMPVEFRAGPPYSAEKLSSAIAQLVAANGEMLMMTYGQGHMLTIHHASSRMPCADR